MSSPFCGLPAPEASFAEPEGFPGEAPGKGKLAGMAVEPADADAETLGRFRGGQELVPLLRLGLGLAICASTRQGSEAERFGERGELEEEITGHLGREIPGPARIGRELVQAGDGGEAHADPPSTVQLSVRPEGFDPALRLGSRSPRCSSAAQIAATAGSKSGNCSTFSVTPFFVGTNSAPFGAQ
jgi:hypothetical protein